MKNLIKYSIFLIFFAKQILAHEFLLTTKEVSWGSTLSFYKDDTLLNTYKDLNRLLYNWTIKKSPDNKFFGAISNSIGVEIISTELSIFSNKGVLIKTIPRAQEYAWSPDGKYLVCILGQKTEEFGFHSDSLILIDTEKWISYIVDPKVPYQDISWASFDGMVYTTDYGNVYKIDPINKTTVRTKHKGIYFSPTGSYYFCPDVEANGFSLYKSTDDKPMHENSLLGDISNGINFNYWLPTGNTLILGDMFKKKKVIDLDAGKIVKEFEGYMLGYDKVRGEIILCKDMKQLKILTNPRFERVKIK